MDEDLKYIRDRVDSIVERVAQFQVYVEECTKDRNLLFKQLRAIGKEEEQIKTHIIALQTQSQGKSKTFDIVIRLVAVSLTFGMFVSGMVFWIINLNKG